MYTTTPPRPDEPRLSTRSILEELVVGFAMIFVLIAAAAGAYATGLFLGPDLWLALPAALAVAVAIVIALPVAATVLVRAVTSRLEGRRRRRRKLQPTPPADRLSRR